MQIIVSSQVAAWGACLLWAPLQLASQQRGVLSNQEIKTRGFNLYRGAMPLFVGSSFFGLIDWASRETAIAMGGLDIRTRVAATAITGAWTPLIFGPLRAASLARQNGLALGFARGQVNPLAGFTVYAVRNAVWMPLMLVLPNHWSESMSVAAYPVAAGLATLITTPADNLISRKMLSGNSYHALVRGFGVLGPLRGWLFRWGASTVKFYCFNELRSRLEKCF